MLRPLPLHLAGLIALATILPAHDGHHHEEHSAPPKSGTLLPAIRITLDENGKPNPWNHLNFHNDPQAFQFAIVSDRTGGARAGVFEDAVAKLNLLQPEFVMSVGDLIEGYTKDMTEINAQWDEFQGFISKLEMPFFYVAGNHDQSNPTMADIWQERFGRSHYSFVYHDVLFLCLNSQEPEMHHISEAQAQWVSDTLAAHPDVRWTLVFLHSPLWEYSDSESRGWNAVEQALQGRDHTVFAGHFHSYLKSERNDARYYILATTGGGSSLRGPAYGEFDQVAWVTMTKDGPLVANLLLDGILADDVRTPEKKFLIDSLSDGVISSSIIWIAPGQSPDQRVEIRSANHSDLPVDVSFNLQSEPSITLMLEQGLGATESGGYAFTLQPKSSRASFLKVDGELHANGHQAGAAGRISWQADLQSPDMGPIRLNGDMVIPFVPRLTLPAVASINADGSLDDWQADMWHDVSQPHLRSSKEGWTGLEDCRFRVAFARDDQNLYIAVYVRDEDVISQSAMAPWKQDGIEVRVDFREPELRHTARVGESGLLFIGTSPAPLDGFDSTYNLKSSSQPSGTVICSKATEVGYIFEAAIPLAGIAEKYGDTWQQTGMRINVAVNDRDSDGQQAQLWWQPDWRTAENIPGSGTLFWE